MRTLKTGLSVVMSAPSKFLTVFAFAAALTASSHARASTYDFSYTVFSTNSLYNGAVISGSFTGSADPSIPGDVDISSVIAVSFNGTPMNGPLYVWSYTDPGGQCSTCWALGNAVASTTNPLNNNFLFIDSKTAGFPGFTNYFYNAPWPNGGQTEATQFYSVATGDVDLYNGEFIPANFTLTQTPLPSTWTLMLIGLFGFGFAAYQQRRKTALPAAA
jgi:hypothetical protein